MFIGTFHMDILLGIPFNMSWQEKKHEGTQKSHQRGRRRRRIINDLSRISYPPIYSGRNSPKRNSTVNYV